MSPEQYRGGEISGAADQYSLGVVAYQCLGGRVPFDAATAYELLNKHVAQPPPPLAEARPGLPPHAYAAIERALAKAPTARFATVSDFVSALAGRTAPAIPQRPARRRRRTLVTWGAGIAAAAVALYGISLRARAPHAAQPPRSSSADDTLARASPAPTRPVEPTAARPSGIATKQAPSALLIIRITPGWARIYVDGDSRGERPVHREELPPGTHTLRFERPGFVSLDTTLALRPGTNVIEIAMHRANP